MLPDPDTLYASLSARDGRFDGRFDGLAFVCVTTTGIFCRMTCPARTPKPGNCRFRAAVAECVAEGFRPCKRCHPAGPLIASFGRSALVRQRKPTEGEG